MSVPLPVTNLLDVELSPSLNRSRSIHSNLMLAQSNGEMEHVQYFLRFKCINPPFVAFSVAIGLGNAGNKKKFWVMPYLRPGSWI